MKPFRFGLERALAWRRTQARVEEARLEALYAELRNIGAQVEKLAGERNTAGRGLLASGGATGVELALLDLFHKTADAKLARLELAGVDSQQRIGIQREAVTRRRRDVKLLERLRERRREIWQLESARETERDAAEAHLARSVWRAM